MEQKELIEVHAEEEQLIVCACCDSTSVMTNKFYKVKEGNFLSFWSYLDCCKDKMGTVVDWVDLDEYQKPIGKYKIYGKSINIIKGLG
jgi:hypothetical protein